MQIEEVLNRLPLDELKSIAYFSNLPDKGTKRELVSIIASNIAPQRVLELVNIKSLSQLLADEGLPQSGRKNDLIKRVLSIVEAPKGRKATLDKALAFEKQVESWAKRTFKTDFAKTDLATGLNVKRPHQVDVHVQIKGKGLFGQTADIWIECKDRKSSVKTADVSKLVSYAQDVFQAAKAGREELYYNGLMIVSTSKFDVDAVNYANQFDVLCVYFDGKKYEAQNDPKNWVGEPAWLKQVK